MPAKRLRAVKTLLACAVLSIVPRAAASAQTITFDALPGANGSAFTSYSEAGFDVDLFAGFICTAGILGDPVPDLFGGPACDPVNTDSELRIRRSGGGLFTFVGVDLASNNGSSAFGFNAFLASTFQYGGSEVFAFGLATFGAVPGADPFTEIDELRLSLTSIGGTTSYNIDNIRLSTSAVPEPASIALVGTGLVGLAGVVRRRRHTR